MFIEFVSLTNHQPFDLPDGHRTTFLYRCSPKPLWVYPLLVLEVEVGGQFYPLSRDRFVDNDGDQRFWIQIKPTSGPGWVRDFLSVGFQSAD
jgi:hypothetical protein